MNANDISLEERKALPRTKLLVQGEYVEYWDKATTIEYANEQLKKYGLNDWKLEFNMSDYIGQCWSYAKKIYLSERYFYALPAREIADTVLHEIAHALCDIRHGTIWIKGKYGRENHSVHGKEWKAICREIGCLPRAKCPLWQTFGFNFEWIVTVNDDDFKPKDGLITSGARRLMPELIDPLFKKFYDHVCGDFEEFLELCIKAGCNTHDALKEYRNMQNC